MTLSCRTFTSTSQKLHRKACIAAGILIVGVLFAANLSAAETESLDAETAASSVVDRFHDALRGGDRDAARDLLHPDVIVFEGGRTEMSREEYEQHHLGADMDFSAATTRTVEDRRSQVRGDTAWVLSQTKTKGEFRGRNVDSIGIETMVLGRDGESWRILHIHWSSRRSPAAAE